MTIPVDPKLKYQRLSTNAPPHRQRTKSTTEITLDIAIDSFKGRGEVMAGNDYIDALPCARDWSASKLMACPFSSISLPMVNVSW